MELDPHYPPIYMFFLGFAHYAQKQYAEAIAELKRALARSPDHFSTHRTLAIIFSELGRTEEAKAEVSLLLH